MYCILVAGVPASGKTTFSKALGESLQLPVLSKDALKERLFDDLGFSSREEKVALGVAAMHMLYDFAEALMRRGMPFVLENNFEHTSLPELLALLEKYGYTAVTLRLSGDRHVLYERFCARNNSPDRHRGHVVNDQYPETGDPKPVPPPAFEDFWAGVHRRGMDSFCANGPCLEVDTTDFSAVDMDAVVSFISAHLPHKPV